MTETRVNVRVEPDVKTKATKILHNIGLDMSTAINMFLRQVIQHKGIPSYLEKGKEK